MQNPFIFKCDIKNDRQLLLPGLAVIFAVSLCILRTFL
nr:MAG TPA: hypothetical protein [Caudoviricetes sp.]